MNAVGEEEGPPIQRRDGRRAGVGVGLVSGLTIGVLAAGAVMIATVLLAPGSLLSDLLGGEPAPSTLVDPTTDPTPTPIPSATWSGESTPLPFDATQPGGVVALGEPATLLIAGAEGEHAVVEVTAQSVGPAPDKDQRVLQNVAPVLTGQTVYYARLSARWLAGDPLSPVAVGALFTLITADGTAIPTLTLIDWATCETPSIPGGFDTTTEPTAWCVAAASPSGGLVPVGLRFSQQGGPYDSSDGEAAVRWVPQP